MKKFQMILAVTVMLLCFYACGSREDLGGGTEQGAVSAPQQANISVAGDSADSGEQHISSEPYFAADDSTRGASAEGGSTESDFFSSEITESAAAPSDLEAPTNDAGISFDEWSDAIADFFFERAEEVPMSPPQRQTNPRTHLLTAGIWNDNENHDFLVDLIQTNSDFRVFQERWLYNLSKQVTAYVTSNGSPVNNVRVELIDQNQNVLFAARTNNKGVAYLFADFVPSRRGEAAFIRVENGESKPFNPSVTRYDFILQGQSEASGLDLMFVIDTTGSMGDELEYLKVELTDIIQQVNRQHANLDIRLSVIVYRDVRDEYVVRSSPFTTDINSQVRFIEAQRAAGGGDWEEAVEQALAAALDEQDWNDSAAAKLLFLVLDAPPHNRPQIRDEMHRVTLLSAEKGVRIIPIASSGIDTITEFLLRALSTATGGTYLFITGHSGVGSGHIDPTIDNYEVRLLNDLIVQVINGYLH